MLEAELGFKGERGYSNYELAVKNGYQGTEQEWINHFGLDLNVCVLKDDIAVYSGTIDPDDPEFMLFVSIELPEGWTKDNTVILCCKERQHTNQGGWAINNLYSSSTSPTVALLALVDGSGESAGKTFLQYANNYYNIESIVYDYQITLMRMDLSNE